MRPPSLVALLLLATPFAAAQDSEPKPDAPRVPVEAKKPVVPLIADEALRNLVRESLRKKPGEPLTEKNLRDVYFVEARGAGVADLSGLEHCVNLASADLAENGVADLTPLADLRDLQLLDLAGNDVADLAPLAELESLQYLHLAENRVRDLSPLKDLSRLSALYLTGNRVEDLSPLTGLKKLTSLDLAGNAVTDLAPLAELRWLSSLDLKGNHVADLSPLGGLTELRYTFLQDNALTDLSPLPEMAEKDAAGDSRFAPYWRLYVAGNPLSEAAKTAQVERLRAAGVRVEVGETP